MSQRGPEPGALANLTSRYAGQGIELPHDLNTRLQQRLAPFSLADLEPGVPAERLVGAWQATRSAPRDEDEVWIILLHMFRARFGRFVPGLKEALHAQRMGVIPTRIQVALQLGSRCFHLGRRLVALDADSRSGRLLLEECVELLSEVAAAEPRLKEHTLRQYRGQLATSLTILARRSPAEDLPRILGKAEENSRIAEELGDRTEQHFAYRAEIGLRLFHATQDDTHLDSAQTSVAAVPSIQTKRLRSVAADVVAQQGYAQIRKNEVADGIALLRTAENSYGKALDLVEADGVDDGYLLTKRAELRNQLYRVAVDPHGRRDSRLLDSALADWLDPRASAHSHDASVANALLDRARIRARRNDQAGASTDREQARALLPHGVSPQTDAKLRAAELEHAVSDAITSDDIGRVRQLVEEMVHLNPDAVVPSAALARACKLLAIKTDEAEWAPLAVKSLDRLEMDLAHPSVSAPAARSIAGHAALLSWLLARRADDKDLLSRTVQLYRTSFESVPLQPSVDALANAGTCALALGKRLLAGDEADAEEAAALFTEGVSWLGMALQRAASSPASVRGDFDPVMAHSRLGETALRAYPLTWDESLLETAVEHLGAARDLGENAVELIGLLGDAHYRRGSRQRDPDDLERAIALKDDAFAAGARQRENRSLTAAAAMKLFGMTDEPQLLTDAAARALQSALCDPTWPWAVIQLAELATRSASLDAESLSTAEPRELAVWVVGGNRQQLLRHAAELAVHTEEFSASILGGQQRSGDRGVRVLNDPHRLIEQTIVLKRLARDAAHSERDETVFFGQWLSTVPAQSNWVLPEPLAVVDLPGGDSVYAMRRAQGRVLGASVVEWHTGTGDDPRPRFREALRYLAAFQAWRVSTDERFPSACGAPERTAFQAQLEKAGRKLDLDENARNLLNASCDRFLVDGMPAVAKKDPHSGNWLWTRRDELVLIDIEATVALPLLQEVVTIIDDLPLFDLTAEGWSERRGLCREYVETLQGFGYPRISERFPLMECYEAMATLHAIKGLGRLRAADPGISSFSLEARRMQEAHYRQLLEYMRSAAIQPEVRELATTIQS